MCFVTTGVVAFFTMSKFMVGPGADTFVKVY